MNTNTHIDKLIISLCTYTEEMIVSDNKYYEHAGAIAENTKALAELLSARASDERN